MFRDVIVSDIKMLQKKNADLLKFIVEDIGSLNAIYVHWIHRAMQQRSESMDKSTASKSPQSDHYLIIKSGGTFNVVSLDDLDDVLERFPAEFLSKFKDGDTTFNEDELEPIKEGVSLS